MENPFKERYGKAGENDLENGDALEREVTEELEKARTNAEALRQDLGAVDEEEFEKLHEKQKKSIFTTARKLVFIFGTLAAIPLAGSILKPEMVDQINKFMGDFVNNNFKEIFATLSIVSVLLFGKLLVYDPWREKHDGHKGDNEEDR